MPRINLATDIKTRTGAPEGKDARLKNAYVETRGEQSVVRKRPVAQGGVAVGSGTPQGGYGTVLFWGDTPYVIDDTTGTTCNGATSYSTGDHVTVDYVDYWALTDHVGNCPTSGPNSEWSTSFVSAVPAEYAVAAGNATYAGAQPSFYDAPVDYTDLVAVIDQVIPYSSAHSAPTLSELAIELAADIIATTPNLIGTYSGSVLGQNVTGTFTAAIELNGTPVDDVDVITMTALNTVIVLSSSCSQPLIIPNGTAIGEIPSLFNVEADFTSHP